MTFEDINVAITFNRCINDLTMSEYNLLIFLTMSKLQFFLYL